MSTARSSRIPCLSATIRSSAVVTAAPLPRPAEAGEGKRSQGGAEGGAGVNSPDQQDTGPAVNAADQRQLDTHELTTSDHMAGGANSPLDTDFENVWTNGSAADGSFDGAEAFGDWSSRGGGGNFEDGDFNLEQTLSGDLSLRDHLIGQMNVDLTDPVDRLIGLALIDLLDAAGYVTGSLADLAEQLNCDLEHIEAGSAAGPALRSARHLRPQPQRMSGDPVAGAQPPRPGDPGPARQSGTAGGAQRAGAAEGLRRRCRGSVRHGVRDPHARPQAGAPLRPSGGPDGHSRHPDAGAARTAAG